MEEDIPSCVKYKIDIEIVNSNPIYILHKRSKEKNWIKIKRSNDRKSLLDFISLINKYPMYLNKDGGIVNIEVFRRINK